MKNSNTGHLGFTLIELLVVVLIIGILAAVALPQYRVAVEKARAVRLLPLLSSIANAEKVYKLANGTYVRDFTALDIDMPAGAKSELSTLFVYDGFNCSFAGTAAPDEPLSVMCSMAQGVRMEKYFSGQAYCWANTDVARKVCKAICHTTAFSKPTEVSESVGCAF